MATPRPLFLEAVEEARARLQAMELAGTSASHTEHDVEAARRELRETIKSVFAGLTPWQQCQLARHPERPHTMAYTHSIFTDFTEIHGDRRFSDDPAVVAGLARFDDEPVVVVGHQKGRDTAEKLRRNFGMPRPDGYRKAMRAMALGARFRRPVISFVDTPGAYPGIDAEERGQAEAIANNLIEMAALPVPIIVVVTGEGGSGGALALGIGDRVLMLEHAIYSVISPEGCAAILWKDQARAEDAARALRLTARDLKGFGVIDEILPEPPGGAHVDPAAMAETVAAALRRNLRTLRRIKPDALVARRYKKFRAMGIFNDR
ncbi:MAG: acetyl-CoA carboxylase carboxyltransferase subunit alpha [Thermoanaerobaculales bacterium]|jgi:acetyl-CoA carboxylase carboxyl transferase subunit alpha|nr:acetyl-CoA carboxylase carboxyltransferase subunit alpha [Thermoanaerobaculales bacterium]